MNDEQKQYVLGIYTNPRNPVSFGSLNKLYQFIKSEGRYNIDRKTLENFMREHEIFSSHIARQKLKAYAKIIAPYPNYQLELDTAVLPFKSRNFKYLVIGRDAFSKRIAAKPVRRMTASEVDRAVNNIINEIGPFERVRTDRYGMLTMCAF